MARGTSAAHEPGSHWFALGLAVFIPLGTLGTLGGIAMGLLTGNWLLLWAGVALMVIGIALPLLVMAVMTLRIRAGVDAAMKDILEQRRIAEHGEASEHLPSTASRMTAKSPGFLLRALVSLVLRPLGWLGVIAWRIGLLGIVVGLVVGVFTGSWLVLWSSVALMAGAMAAVLLRTAVIRKIVARRDGAGVSPAP